ncbi:disks large homolog 5-like [Cricetulus griseus]|uniref:Disks large homolog 5-like n=1 Tax=Cricetulus griseus TaxID=10029 RepID=A0A9J7HBR0_CRIGR|nr:disks large homolog 5-like [Cricetulus griseus]
MGSFLEDGGLYILYALSPSNFTCVHLPIEAATELSTHPALLTKKQVKKEMERLNKELQLMTNQRNELRDRLLFITEGNVEKRPYYRPNPSYEKLKMEHNEVVAELQSLQSKNTEASEKLDDLAKETSFYRGLHSRLLMEQTKLKKKVDILRQENKKRMEDWFLLKHHLREWKLICKNQEEKTSDLQTQQKVRAGRQLEQATAQDESLLQKQLLTQEPPADPDSEQILKSGDALSSSDFISYV